MWQFIVDRALMMYGQATTGVPVVPNAAAPIQIPGQTAAQPQHTIWHTLLLLIYFVICLGLVIAVLLQTTKSEGLSGIIGGSAQSVFRGKKGFEERLQEITNYLAVSFLVISFLVSVFAFRTK